MIVTTSFYLDQKFYSAVFDMAMGVGGEDRYENDVVFRQLVWWGGKVKKFGPFLDLCVSSLRRGHANLLCIVPILSDVSEETSFSRRAG